MATTSTSATTSATAATVGGVVVANPNVPPLEEVSADTAAPKPPRENPYKDFEKDFLQFTFDEPFLSSISSHIIKVEDWNKPTAYVAVSDMSVDKSNPSYRLVMGHNPEFMAKHTTRQRQGIIMHEMFHVALKHLTNRNTLDKKLAKMHNFATDLAINSLIGKARLPTSALIPGQIFHDAEGKPISSEVSELIKSLPTNQSSEFYFERLREFAEEQKKKNPGGDPFAGAGTLDDHDMWDNMPADVQEEFENHIRNILQDAVNDADRKNQWGTIPHDMREMIRKSLSREVDWRSILRAFIGRVRSQDRESTIKRINKKLPYIFPGVKRTFISNFACFVDQSGSMSNEDISLLFGEMEGLAKHVEIDCFNFDTEIDVKSHFKWKRGKKYPELKRTKCGGTDFNCIANFCNNPKTPHWDGIIILTDGYAPTMSMIRGSKILWVVTPTGTKEYIREGDLVIKMTKDDKLKKFGKK